MIKRVCGYVPTGERSAPDWYTSFRSGYFQFKCFSFGANAGLTAWMNLGVKARSPLVAEVLKVLLNVVNNKREYITD